ncbi:NACHT, LRR and PYD domains-containing protein 3 isoform X2 [Salmo trutta]|uniref:NACHT, LRR and PYD domains-containing protein 3 isoform X2 n=1 Tax=Salmo trutta TaxID=8032 RepID=UPI0011315D58|nr:NACHT, LRR and PYD domains-containing protein 3-like isoform X2 [Salmo trutta]
MSRPGEKKEGTTASKMSLPQDITSESVQQHRAESPTPSLLSMKSDNSMFLPPTFNQETQTVDKGKRKRAESPTSSLLSMKSDNSMFLPPTFNQHPLNDKSGITIDLCERGPKDQVSIPCGHSYCKQCISVLVSPKPLQHQHAESSHYYAGPGDVACDLCTEKKLKAVKSCLICTASYCESHVRQHYTVAALQKHTLVEVTGNLEQKLCQLHHKALEVFCKTDQILICNMCAVEDHRGHRKRYIEIPMLLDTSSLLGQSLKNMSDLNLFKNHLIHCYPECFETQLDNEDVQDLVEKMLESFGTEGALKITLNFLDIQNKTLWKAREIKTKLGQKFQQIFEGIGHNGKQTLLNDIYTELYITEGGSGEVNNEHEVRHIETVSKEQTTQKTAIKCNNIFKRLPGQRKPIRTVLTKGIAGIGKTVSVQKFILDWAEGKANQDIHFIFPLPFRDLNLKKGQYSLMQLLQYYCPDLKDIDSIQCGEIKTLFIFDGLDECRHPLNFQNNEDLYDITEPTSVDVLLTNLIKGNLLPSSHLWITTRPAAANQIPFECVDQVTEVKGFSDPQKEEYFRKIIGDEDLASRIITQMKTSKSLYIMCHMPVFCWISATVLETMLKETKDVNVPKSLTQMNTHFLLIQTSVKNKKYNKATENNPKKLSQLDKFMILKLGKLAFQQLQKGNLIFYEEDLTECGIDVTEASEYSALCTEMFKDECGLYQDKVFSFVHLSIQEFLAALYALESWLGKSENVFDESFKCDKLSDLHMSAVDKALQSKNGHLDLFLRFLLGLSLESSQNLLKGLLTRRGQTPSIEETFKYLSDKIKMESSPERIINLFHCLNELGDNSVVEEIQTSLRSGTLSETKLQPHQCSALAFVLLMSEGVLDEFHLKTYNTSVEGRLRLLPVVKTCKKASLAGCDLTYTSCWTLASALQTPNCPLTELDLSYNDLGDRGVKLLCAGLHNIQTLILGPCGLTEGCCLHLASVLRAPNSQLQQLELRYNDLHDSGVTLLCAGLKDPNCKLQTLGLSQCGLTEGCCSDLASVLCSTNSQLKQLELRDNDLQDSGVTLLSDGLADPNCKLQKLGLGQCGLTEGCCSDLASVLRAPNSQLKQLELRDNDLQDSGVTLLSDGLGDPNCELQTLGLSGCEVTEEGCAALASALRSNPSHLRELDLSYNHPGDSAGGLLSAGQGDPTYKLMKLNVDHGAECRLVSGLRKYACQLTMDPNTANTHLLLSKENRKVTRVDKEQHYEDHPDRFKWHPQVLCREGLSGSRYYWEVMWDCGEPDIGVTYKGMSRMGWGSDSWIGQNTKSWSLNCAGEGYYYFYNAGGNITFIRGPVLHRVGVYLDWPAGTLSFYSVSFGKQKHLHTFYTTFTEPLYPGFWIYPDSSLST